MEDTPIGEGMDEEVEVEVEVEQNRR